MKRIITWLTVKMGNWKISHLYWSVYLLLLVSSQHFDSVTVGQECKDINLKHFAIVSAIVKLLKRINPCLVSIIMQQNCASRLTSELTLSTKRGSWTWWPFWVPSNLRYTVLWYFLFKSCFKFQKNITDNFFCDNSLKKSAF